MRTEVRRSGRPKGLHYTGVKTLSISASGYSTVGRSPDSPSTFVVSPLDPVIHRLIRLQRGLYSANTRDEWPRKFAEGRTSHGYEALIHSLHWEK